MCSQNSKIREIQFLNSEFLPEISKILDEGHTVTLKLRGRSMRPFLEDGRDKALIKKADDIHVGDAVLAEIFKGVFVLHRIISIDGDNVTLRGDGNLNTERCTRKDVKGTVVGFYSKGRPTLDSTDSMKWKVYSYLWTRLYPIRRYLLAFHRIIWLRIFPPKTSSTQKH